ncbi:SigB/SigF/SigG family RNA polymerase sigma factor [Paraconexibacter antarcticus]|uniref:SigB/SigF/SigG family RNA polymerase sigma factor n=1 Tax=Paraconexibacter antarcticus TaxID=2949664 RepID=A0ABY5DYI4_9ACTN|nr:SigB/SigF/SigG family RNA polymerase sigma factor [Paraconexibacter antarcticus]UTI65927.1 SigB/SigF/SigG family RNA polymerase sigma factor [Paraconexibacter antarcticus]
MSNTETVTPTAALDDEAELLRRYHLEGDRAARAILIERMMPLVRHMARRYAGRGEPLDDLVQVGAVGLLKAVDRFDVERGFKLSTFAAPNIAGEIKRHFRDRGWSIRVPRDIQELNAKLTRAVDRLTVTEGRAPTIAELAVATDSTEEQVLEAMQGAQNYSTVSFEEPVGDNRTALDLLGEEDDGFMTAERRVLLDDGMRALAGREREIVRLRFFEGLTQREIADRVGISQMHVSRLLRRSLDELRTQLTDTDERPAARPALRVA